MNKNVEALTSIRQVSSPSDKGRYDITVETVGKLIRLCIISPGINAIELDLTTEMATSMVMGLSVKIEAALRNKKKHLKKTGL